MRLSKSMLVTNILLISIAGSGQGRITWMKDGTSYTKVEGGEIVKYSLPANTRTVMIAKNKLVPAGQTSSIAIRSYSFSADGKKALLYTNAKKVWRLDTRGDYWVLDLSDNS